MVGGKKRLATLPTTSAPVLPIHAPIHLPASGKQPLRCPHRQPVSACHAAPSTCPAKQDFREPLYLTDKPVVYKDTRTEEERRYPQLFRWVGGSLDERSRSAAPLEARSKLPPQLAAGESSSRPDAHNSLQLHTNLNPGACPFATVTGPSWRRRGGTWRPPCPRCPFQGSTCPRMPTTARGRADASAALWLDGCPGDEHPGSCLPGLVMIAERVCQRCARQLNLLCRTALAMLCLTAQPDTSPNHSQV